jgi:hypothetical protein
LFVATGVIYWLGRHEHARLSKTSDRKRVHGQYIPEWVAFGFVSPALFMLYHGIEVFTGYPGAVGMCFFGLLCGLAMGWVHGAFRLRWDTTLGTIDDVVIPHSPPQDGNPYRPPQGG